MMVWIWLVFIVAVGACVGSFLNVVILRLPAGEGIVSSPSACPKCGHKLAWFENVPVVSWLALRGRCRKCHSPISAQYPLIEAATAVLFGGLAAWYYGPGTVLPADAAFRPVLADAGLAGSWPVLAMHLVLVAGLLAATAIDLKYYIIPIGIPWTVTAIAAVGYPLAAGLGLLPAAVSQWPVRLIDQVVPVSSVGGLGAAIGGVIGLGASLALVRFGVLPRSFDDELAGEVDEPGPGDSAGDPATQKPGPAGADQPAEAVTDPEQMIAHPHPRREISKEAAFLALPVLGMTVGLLVMPLEAAIAEPLAVRVLGGVLLGYLIGGGLVWATRVLGTLGFGKEAMGLGDVHLLAAIGAVVGGIDAVFVFFIAPFVGIAVTLLGTLASRLKKKTPRVIPFGPSLAAAALVMLLFRDALLHWLLIR
jgi:leader peptidase (prepilin peptidase)/N-methyltransferase